MLRSLHRIFRCPACGSDCGLDEFVGDDDHVLDGVLSCRSCPCKIPVLEGFPISAQRIQEQGTATALEALREKLFGSELDYLQFLREKRERKHCDAYAAARPFLESTRSVEPLLGLLREQVKPGDFILDTWCRTGWTAEFLAARFPEQQIVALWESAGDVLGTRGFRHWLGTGKRLPNWDLVFHNPGERLPFADGSFSAIHGLDTLHRYPLDPLLAELLRVARRDAPIVLPHVHLTNSDPDPFFERGARQVHGTTWRRYLRWRLAGSTRESFVLSERSLFEASRHASGAGFVLEDQADTQHYNGAVVITGKGRGPRALPWAGVRDADWDRVHVVINPMLAVDESSRVVVHPDAMGGGARHLLRHHPLLKIRYEAAFPLELDLPDRCILYLAAHARSVREIAARLDRPVAEVDQRLRRLEGLDVIRVEAVSPAQVRLQRHVAGRESARPAASSTLATLWSDAVRCYASRDYLVWSATGETLSYGDVDVIARTIAECLSGLGYATGSRIIVAARAHPETAFAFWGIVLAGMVPVVVDPEVKALDLDHIIAQSTPCVALIDSLQEQLHAWPDGCQVFGIGDAAGASHALLRDRVAGMAPRQDTPDVDESAPAVVLFTSGSTGPPKGIVLAHGGIARSSESVDRVWRWHADDRYVSLGGPHTMSGLRNPYLVPLHAGASTVLVAGGKSAGPFAALAACAEHGGSILGATPAFLNACLAGGSALDRFRLDRLRMVLCTGATLPESLRRGFEERFGCRVYDYYGLTETSGICMGVDPDIHGDRVGLGRAIDAVTAVLDDAGRPVRAGEQGELALFSENLLLGTLDSGVIRPYERVRGGVLYTGDVVRVDERGCFHFAGRQDRLLIDPAGENYSPVEVERVLRAVPGVHDVFVTAIGIGREVGAILVIAPDAPRRSESEWWRSVRDAAVGMLKPSRLPTRLVITNRVPVSPNGKWDPALVQTLLQGPLFRDLTDVD